MLYRHGLKRGLKAVQPSPRQCHRQLHNDGCQRLSNFWTPTQSKKPIGSSPEDSNDLLVRAGFLRQAHSGIFHLLPLGLRVQDKIERLVDKHMTGIGASKVSLSSLTSEDLWQRSGRLEKGRGNEFFQLEDRKGGKLLLSPTHEEEITTVVAGSIHSHKQLPLRLYQVSRKYRDEARPRQGLLRGREFMMKDLYTFDATAEGALETYDVVRTAYRQFLDDLSLPYLVADADSGSMGGNLSHEYHFASPSGEDVIIQCDSCGSSVNEELYIGRPIDPEAAPLTLEQTTQSYMISKDRTTLLCVCHPKDTVLNGHALKAVYPDIDLGVEDARSVFSSAGGAQQDGRAFAVLSDPRTEAATAEILATGDLQRRASSAGATAALKIIEAKLEKKPVLLTTVREGDTCAHCHTGSLSLHKAVEIGHTFHLGTRYSEPLNLRVTGADNKQSVVHMGCHGIGVSRLIAAAAGCLSDDRGLGWPMAIAPFHAVIIGASQTSAEDVESLYHRLHGMGVQNTELDAVMDDRADYAMGWKLNDADLIGYPFILVLGKAWKQRRAVELQCRRMGIKEEIEEADLVARIDRLCRDLQVCKA